MKQWLYRLVELSRQLTPEQRHDLETWERNNVGGRVASSEWPGWAQIGETFREDGETFTAFRARTRSRKAFIPPALRWEVWERDDFRCRSCGARRFLTVDHIMPESRGGTLQLANLQTLCKSCNSRKGSRLLPKRKP